MRLIVISTLITLSTTLFAQTQQEWWRNAAVYQIYPRSYQDTNGDGIGDLEGIISRLDYIKDMGFTAIWISPFFTSPQGDFGYDIANYRDCDEDYGTFNDITRLIDEIHDRNMHVIFDMVMNHTSDQHPWFLESRSSRDSPKRDWYVWQAGKGKKGQKPPTNWKAMIGGNGWHYDEESCQWYWATFLPFQPDLNYHNPEVRLAMLDNVRFWLDRGVDGFRLDIFNSLFEDSLFRDNPFSTAIIPSEENPDGFFQHMEHTVNQPATFAFAKELRAVVDEYTDPPRYLVGEVFGDAETIKQYLGEEHDGLHTIFLFEMLSFDFSADYFRSLIEKYEEELPHPYQPVWVFSNHDRKRSISRMGDNLAKAKLLAMLQLTIRGTSFTFMGEEIGMTQARIPLKDAKDALVKQYHWIPQFLANLSSESLNRDECRTPMQWDTTANAGFCQEDAEPWLPVQENRDTRNVQVQLADSTSLLNHYQQYLQLRQEHDAFNSPYIELLPADQLPKNVLGYKRGQGSKAVTILLNFKAKPVQLTAAHVPEFISGEEVVELTGYDGKVFIGH